MLSKFFFKKIFLTFLVTCYLSLVTLFPFASSVHAQSSSTQTWYHQDFKSWFDRVYGSGSPANDVFGERYTAAQVEWIIYGLFAFAINSAVSDARGTSCYLNNDIKNCAAYVKDLLTLLPKASQASTQNASILSYIFSVDRPLSGISYVQERLRNLHLIPEAKAQTIGFGFGALNPVRALWSAARNISYGILVLAILIISFMIMFRVKINPQTVISVQSTLPKIIIALILITFSYAIAGFMVDLMYVVIGLFSLIFSQAYRELGATINPDVFFGLMTQGPLNTGVLGILGSYMLAFTIALVAGILGSGGIVAGLPLGIALGLFLGIILIIVVFIALLIAFFRIIWMLFKAFVMTILLVIFAPLQIAIGIVLSGAGFGAWLKSFLSHLSVFPVTGLFFTLAFLFLYVGVSEVLQKLSGPLPLDQLIAVIFANIPLPGAGLVSIIANQQGGWPPLIGSQNAIGLIYVLVSLVILLLVPKVSDIIKGMIEGKPLMYGAAIGEAVGLPVTAGRFGAATGFGYAGERLTRGLRERQQLFINPIIQQIQKLIAGGR